MLVLYYGGTGIYCREKYKACIKVIDGNTVKYYRLTEDQVKNVKSTFNKYLASFKVTNSEKAEDFDFNKTYDISKVEVMKEASEHRKVLAIKSIIRQFSGERLELKVMDQGGDLAVYTLDEAQAEILLQYRGSHFNFDTVYNMEKQNDPQMIDIIKQIKDGKLTELPSAPPLEFGPSTQQGGLYPNLGAATYSQGSLVGLKGKSIMMLKLSQPGGRALALTLILSNLQRFESLQQKI